MGVRLPRQHTQGDAPPNPRGCTPARKLADGNCYTRSAPYRSRSPQIADAGALAEICARTLHIGAVARWRRRSDDVSLAAAGRFNASCRLEGAPRVCARERRRVGFHAVIDRPSRKLRRVAVQLVVYLLLILLVGLSVAVGQPLLELLTSPRNARRSPHKYIGWSPRRGTRTKPETSLEATGPHARYVPEIADDDFRVCARFECASISLGTGSTGPHARRQEIVACRRASVVQGRRLLQWDKNFHLGPLVGSPHLTCGRIS